MSYCRLRKDPEETFGCTVCQEFCRLGAEVTSGVGSVSCNEQDCGDGCELCLEDLPESMILRYVDPAGEA